MKYAQMVSMPSAVSDWLVGQLEARGIDAVLYTRYVLSLLHSHPIDLIYQDDLQHPHFKKEVGKSNGGRKRSRKSSSDWWRYAQADAEQIKRSAAVQCLVSASDQNCEIESLVDELCDKLKEVESEASTPTADLAEAQPEVRKLTPQELAEKYYAAFPPLLPMIPRTPETSTMKPAASPDKPAVSPFKKRSARKLGSRTCFENKLHAKENIDMKSRSQNKRLTRFARNRLARPRSASFIAWEENLSNRRIKATAEKMEESPAKDQRVEPMEEPWSSPTAMSLYQEIHMDIRNLLKSPSPGKDNTETVSMANMKTVGARKYLPYGTNTTSSIWSTNPTRSGGNSPTWSAGIWSVNNNDSPTVDADKATQYCLDFEFKSIRIDGPPSIRIDGPYSTRFGGGGPPSKPIDEPLKLHIPKQEATFVFEDPGCGKLYATESDPRLRKMPVADRDGSGGGGGLVADRYADSLLMINHDAEASGFARVPARSDQSKPFNLSNQPLRSSRRRLNFDKEEDLLTSEKSHFKPINEKPSTPYRKYADGSTFVISNKLEQVSFSKSPNGSLWLADDQQKKKKYVEYKDDEVASLNSNFVIKFLISQNDKACQTDILPHLDSETDVGKANAEDDVTNHMYYKCKPKPEDHCTCPNDEKPAMETDNCTFCLSHRIRSESVLGEMMWKFEMRLCAKCNNNSYTSKSDWPSKGQMDSDWYDRGLRDIWSGEEYCQACMSSTGGSADLQLREDIIQDGEQLLSDLSTFQREYMEQALPDREPSIDLGAAVTSFFAEEAAASAAAAPPSERKKRRHSFILRQQLLTDWSFASRLEEDCVIQMSTLPTLRSVTL